LYDKDLVLWTQLLAETLNARMMDGLRERGHARLRYSHGFLFQQLVEGARPVGEIAANLGVTSQAVSKSVRELEALGYVSRSADPRDARVRRVALTSRGRDAVEAAREIRERLNSRFASALGDERAAGAAPARAHPGGGARGLDAVLGRRVPPAQGLGGEGR
jgi:DNA-binding MarR family transcriptional regulator